MQYGDTNIHYELSYTDRQTLAIHVHPDLSVTVEAPLESEFPEIEKRLHKKAAWILRQQRNFRRYSFEIPPRQYVSGETHRYLGQQYRLKVLQSEDGKESVYMDREQKKYVRGCYEVETPGLKRELESIRLCQGRDQVRSQQFDIVVQAIGSVTALGKESREQARTAANV